jgi:catechol 2,3-dioxygenase-like lactoylglutathione lyase family enzyme
LDNEWVDFCRATLRDLPKMSDYHLVHANVARARGPLDSPVMAGFVSQVEEINALARGAAGFVAQPRLPDEGGVYSASFLVNVSVLESVESLDAFTHEGKHATMLERRGEWFHPPTAGSTYVLYWLPKGHVVTEKEVKERLDHLGRYGPTPYAFTFAHRFTAAQAWGSVQAARLDHLVLTVNDVDASCAFYEAVLGVRVVTFGAGRKTLAFGRQKINLHSAGREFEPKAGRPTPGSADLCFLTELPLEDVVTRLTSQGVCLIEGPVPRTGAVGPLHSVYFRDPDGNLIEVANALPGDPGS